MPNSPLNEADPMSLDELFSIHPDNLTDENIQAIVERLREDRARFVLADAEAKKSGKRVTTKKRARPEGPRPQLPGLKLLSKKLRGDQE